MTNREFFVQCWTNDYPTFIKVFRAVPPDKLAYRPDPQSRSAGELVWLQVLEKRCWLELLATGKINWQMTDPLPALEDMISEYERAHAELAPHLHTLDDEVWNTQATQFLMDGRVYIEVPLGQMFWLGLFDAIHHRGQLSVYLRPMGARVPSIYGPSADDPGIPFPSRDQ
jgi:uncharacterized damage-inducible protein DinB